MNQIPNIEDWKKLAREKLAPNVTYIDPKFKEVASWAEELLNAFWVEQQKDLDAFIDTHHQQLQKAREERKGWKGYVAVDPKADNYKYSPVFSDRKGAELWVKGKEISGLKVVEVDILLVDHSELDQDKK